MFSKDAAVLQLVAALLPAVIISQPINALAFVWDGVLFGAGGFRYGGLPVYSWC
jgi:Na+-driven multidrug efflux pump